MDIKKIGVAGAGTMGSGIAQAAAQSGYEVILYEPNVSVLEKSRSGMEKNLQMLSEKGKIPPGEAEKILSRILFTEDFSQCIADLFIEAIIEKEDAKITLFNNLALQNTDDTILATNTSSLSVNAIAKKIKQPARVIGMHFFNPATIMKLVEVVHADDTNEQTLQAVIAVAKKMGKTPVICRDSPGFIVNRVARPFYIESLRMVEAGSTTFEQADRLLEASGFKMGPFRLMDLIGNDINYAVSCSVFEQMNEPERLKPSFIQASKVKEGKLGKKTGEGYYTY